MRDVRVAFGSVAPTVVRCTNVEAAVRARIEDGELDRAVSAALRLDISPVDDLRSTARYRLRVAQNLLIQFLTDTLSGRSH